MPVKIRKVKKRRSFKTMALAIEKIDTATGLLSVKDLQSNQKFTISLVPGASIRKIPAEMAAMFRCYRSGGFGVADIPWCFKLAHV